MKQTLVRNAWPSLSGLKELYASITSNMMMQLAFNPQVAAYAAGGDRSVFSEGLFCTLITTLITVPSIAKTLQRARYNGELSADIPASRLAMRLPRSPWRLAWMAGLLLAPVGGGLFLFLFEFYDFTSWTFYQFFWVKFAWLTLLGKGLVQLAVFRFAQPDIGR